MTRILIVRHGQSEWNAVGKWQGQADIPLSDLGRAQAHAAAAKLGTFDGYMASPLLRAWETATIITAHLGVGPITPMIEFVERSAGEWSGLTRAHIEEQWPGYLADGRRPPSYELDDSLRLRVASGLAKVVDVVGPDGTALVFAHGGLIYLLEDDSNRRAGRIPNLGALWLDVTQEGAITIGERVQLINEAELESAQSSDIL
jgi:broad specificity phosphatase PhoE